MDWGIVSCMFEEILLVLMNPLSGADLVFSLGRVIGSE